MCHFNWRVPFGKHYSYRKNSFNENFDEDIENVKFNTAIAKLMTLVNELGKVDSINKTDYETILKLVNPFAPHITEELWEMIGHTDDMAYATWPQHDESKLIESTIEMAVSINGKVRDKITVNIDTAKEDIMELAKSREKIKELHPQLIFLDIAMPGKTGFDLLKDIGEINFEIISTFSFI